MLPSTIESQNEEPAQAPKVLKQLEFEIEEARGPRFLVAVCNNDKLTQDLRAGLNAHQKKISKKVVRISIPRNRGTLVDAILRQTKSATVGLVHLVPVKPAASGSSDKLFSQLNFQRDSLAKLGIPIILWIHGRQLPQLASQAPDLWSRRTAVFYFDVLPIEELLKRIFSSPDTLGNVKADEISRALGEILSAEENLRVCLSRRDRFSLPKADNFIQILRNSIQKLINECSRGRKIDVALWLWNASHIDSRLIRIWRRAYGNSLGDSAYLERNELLLSLAERIEAMLNQYSRELDKRIREKKRTALVALFVAYASNLWRDMVRHAIRKGIPTISIGINSIEIPDLRTTGSTWSEDILKNNAAEQLESWLAGETQKKPPVFSDKEAQILKCLYAQRGNRSRNYRGCDKDLRQQLLTKVRLFLGHIAVGR